jgi:anti-sigma-K factor RskA
VVGRLRCEHEHEDGAYVLGALSAAERAAYERHLETCSFCREAVRDMAELPGLLSRLDARDFARLADTPVPARSRRWIRLVSTAAAAILVLVVGFGVIAWSRDGLPDEPPPGPAVAMIAVEAGSPISATLRLTGSRGGTRLDLVCANSLAGQRYTYRLVVFGPDEQQEQLGSWQPAPGAAFPMQGVTHFGAGSLARVEMVRSDGKVMLAYDVP